MHFTYILLTLGEYPSEVFTLEILRDLFSKLLKARPLQENTYNVSCQPVSDLFLKEGCRARLYSFFVISCGKRARDQLNFTMALTVVSWDEDRYGAQALCLPAR